jgi:antitoxin component YwqK of YwqJK toxin-antitoxin module
LVMICSFSIAQNATDSQGRKQGPWRKVDENGKLKYEGQFKDNIPYGTFKHYHSNGKQKAISIYYNNGTCTHSVLFSFDGIKEAEGKYLNQQKDSVWLYYDVTGEKVLMKESYANNLKDGEFAEYTKEGKLLEVIHYTAGKKNGLWKIFYDDSKPKIVAKYLNGELDSAYTAYFSDGSKKIEGSYKKSGREGNWFYYNATGSINKQEMYINGKLTKTIYWNGTFKTFYSDDIPKEIFTYKDKLLVDEYIEFYNNGTMVKKPQKNEDGSVDEIEVLEGQTIKCKTQYLAGKKVSATFYKENGKVDKTEKY